MPIGQIIGIHHYPTIYDSNHFIVHNVSTILLVSYKNTILTFDVHHLLKDLKKFKFYKSYVKAISARLADQNIMLINRNHLNEEHFVELIKYFSF